MCHFYKTSVLLCGSNLELHMKSLIKTNMSFRQHVVICRLGPFPTLCTVEEASPNYVKGVAPHVLTEPVPLHTHPRIWKAFLVGSFPLQNKLFGLVRNFSIVFCLAHSLGPARHERAVQHICKALFGAEQQQWRRQLFQNPSFSGRPSTLGCPKCPHLQILLIKGEIWGGEYRGTCHAHMVSQQ